MSQGTKTWQYGWKLDDLKKAAGGRCVMCSRRFYRYRTVDGWRTRRLEFAHLRSTGLDGRGRGLRARYLDVVRHAWDYVLLCWPCHQFKLDFIDDAMVRTRVDYEEASWRRVA